MAFPKQFPAECQLGVKWTVKRAGKTDTADCRRTSGALCCNCLNYEGIRARQDRAEREWAADQEKVPKRQGRQRKNKSRALAPRPLKIPGPYLNIFEADNAIAGDLAYDGRMSFWVVCVNVLSISDFTTLLPRQYWDEPDAVAQLPRVTHAIRIKCEIFEKVVYEQKLSRREWLPLNDDGTPRDPREYDPYVHDAACADATAAEWETHLQARLSKRKKRTDTKKPADTKRARLLGQRHVTITTGSTSTCLDVPHEPSMALAEPFWDSPSTHDSIDALIKMQAADMQDDGRMVVKTSIVPHDTMTDPTMIDWALQELLALPESPGLPWKADFDFDDFADQQQGAPETSGLIQDIRLYARSENNNPHTSTLLATTGPASALTFSDESWPALFTQQDVRSPSDKKLQGGQPSIEPGLVTCVTSSPLVTTDLDMYTQFLQILSSDNE